MSKTVTNQLRMFASERVNGDNDDDASWSSSDEDYCDDDEDLVEPG